MSAWILGLLISVRVGAAAAARSTTMARRVDAVDEVPNFMKNARPAQTRRRLDVGSYSYSYAYDDDFASDSSSSDCVNDDYSTDEYEDSCSEWYDDNPGGCGGYDDSNFASNVQCCACGGGTRCDIVVSGSSLPELHGTYEQKGSCNGYPRWKCDEDGGCDQDQYIWYYSDYSKWHIGPDSCSGSAEIYISDPSADPDEDLTAVPGTWSEYVDGEWQPNSAISVACSPNSNIRTAVAAWLSDATAAEAKYGHISGWDTSQVTDMSYLFCADTASSSGLCHAGAASFNEDISEWDTSQVTNMAYTFRKASSFNQPIGGWVVDKVEDFSWTFKYASVFNQDLSGWQVDNVNDMGDMFKYAEAFDQNLGWCAAYGVDLEDAFYDSACEASSCGVLQAESEGGDCLSSAPTVTPAPVWKSTSASGARGFFTKSFLGDDAAVLARSSGEEPASPHHRAGVASMAWRTT